MEVGRDLILITGIRGQQGGAVGRELLANGHKVRGLTRQPDSDRAKEFAALGAEIVYGDFDDPDSLKAPLDGAWGVFAMQNTWEAGVEGEEKQGKLLAELAKQAGVQHYVYTSVGSAHRSTGIPHFDNKWRIEEKLRELDLPSYFILRPVFFMENLSSPWFKPAIDEGQLAIGISPDTELQQIAVEDIGKYGRLAFEQHDELNGHALDIAGDALTAPEAASILSKAAGRSIEHFRVPLEEVRKFSEDFAIMLQWFDEVGYNADIEGNARKFGIEPTSFEDWANRQAF